VHVVTWANRWGIPAQALVELAEIVGTQPTATHDEGLSEAAVQNNVRLEASRHDCLLWRNNTGAYEDDRGVPVRYGLCNDSKKLNKKVKSADLIGVRKVLVVPEMVGNHVGLFVARECKPAGWTYAGTEREAAQLKFINIINANGGDAAFTEGKF